MNARGKGPTPKKKLNSSRLAGMARRHHEIMRKLDRLSATKNQPGGNKAWYVFYIPKGRMPKSFGGKSGWNWPKAYFGPYESRAAAVSAVQGEMAYFEQPAARYKIRHVMPREFTKLWGRPPESDFAAPWSVTVKKSGRGWLLERLPIQPGIYKHYGGGRYRVLFEAHDSTNGPREGISMVVYVSLTTGRINVRDALEFVEYVTADGVSVPRFVLEDAT